MRLPADEPARLDELITPDLNFPSRFPQFMALDWQQAGTAINGIASDPFSH